MNFIRAAATTEDDLSHWAEKLIVLARKELQHGWSEAEFTLVTLFILAGLRAKDDRWLQLNLKNCGGQSHVDSEQLRHSKATFEQLEELIVKNLPTKIFLQFFNRPLALLRKNIPDPGQRLIHLCDHWRWRAVPRPVWKSLKNWHSLKFNLKLRFDIPSPREVLEMQIQGERCVSVFCQAQQLQQIHEHHRDAFLFITHDLEHAWEFFSRSDFFYYQKAWSQLLHSTFITGPWQSFLDPSLQDGFDYLLSDMNSHPWHAFLTLKNLWLQHWKIKCGLKPTERLAQDEEERYKRSWQELLKFWRMDEFDGLSPAAQMNYFLQHLEESSNKKSFILNEQSHLNF